MPAVIEPEDPTMAIVLEEVSKMGTFLTTFTDRVRDGLQANATTPVDPRTFITGLNAAFKRYLDDMNYIPTGPVG